MKKRLTVFLLLLSLALIAVLCACTPTSTGSSKEDAPVVSRVQVLRKASDYNEVGELPCALADENGKIETVVMTVELWNPKKYIVQTLRVNGKNYAQAQFRTATYEKIVLELNESLPKVGEYEETPETHDFHLDAVFYRAGAQVLSVSEFDMRSVTMRINPKFQLTLDITATGKKDKSDMVFEVGFMERLGMLPNVGQMNPSGENVAEDADEYGKIGYGFLGWYTTAEDTAHIKGELFESGQDFERFSDLKLYARYERMFTYEVEEDESGEYAVITGLNSTAKERSFLVVPSEIDGYPIRELGEDSFRNAINVILIKFNANIRAIGDRAFMNLTNLRDFVLPDTCERIGNYAFAGCTKISGKQDLKSVKEIGDYAFRGVTWNTQAPLTIGISENTLYIPETVEKIGKGAFSESNFRNVWFSCESKLNKNTMGAEMFRDSKYLRTVVFGVKPDRWTERAEKGITYIPAGAFMGCCSMETPVLQEGLTEIGENAFGGLKGVTSITLPASLRIIGKNAFADSYVASIGFAENSRLTDLGDYAFANTKLTEVHLKTRVLARYGASPFYNTSVNAIFIYTFNGRAPEFAGKSDLQMLDETVKYFVPAAGVQDYRENWNLTGWFGTEKELRIYPMEDVMEDSVTHKRYAFRISANDDGTETACVTHLFEREENAAVPAQINANGKSYPVTAVSDYVVWQGVKSVNLPSTLTEIGDLAFSGCTELRTVRIDGRADPKNRWDNVRTIGEYAFYNTAITHFTAGRELRSVAAYAFYCCFDLEYVELENGMGYDAAELSADLTDGVRIGYDAFNNAKKLQRVVIGKTVSHVEYAAFANAPVLTSVTIDKGTMLYNTKDAVAAIKRVFDADTESTERIVIYVPSQRIAVLYGETENRYDTDSKTGTANWKGYNYRVIA